MDKLTLDMNCLIDLQDGKENMVQLLDLYHKKIITIQVAGISASERLNGGLTPTHYQEFKDRLASLGIPEIKVIEPIMTVGVTYWGESLLGSMEMEKIDKDIFEILFPARPYAYSDMMNLIRGNG